MPINAGRFTGRSGLTGQICSSRITRAALILVCVATCVVALAQLTGPLTIAMIAFYGYDGLDTEAAKAALTFKVGDSIPMDKLGDTLTQSKEAIRKATGSEPTDIAPVCCDARGQWVVYVGLAGRSSHPFTYNPTPTGKELLPAGVLDLVTKIEQENFDAVKLGNAKEDDTHGYALVSYPPMRKLQEKLRQIALKQGEPIFQALAKSSSAEDRAAAAVALGYAKRSTRQIDALVLASRDSDGKVRNNATRALLVIAGSEPKAASKIPAGDFIAMLNSGIWTDRNKGTGLMLMLTASRDAKLLKRLSAEALPSLIEMANWDSNHAAGACMILGRIAGMSDLHIRELMTAGKTFEIIDAAKKGSQ